MNNNHSSSSSTDKRSREINNGFPDTLSVLHVDDDEVFLKVTKIYLEESTEKKIEVDSLINPEQVFRRLQEKAYDVIVADYRMPSMDGLQLLEQLREKNITIPFIIFTGHSREEIAIQALNLGANRYIKKGTDTESQYGQLIHAIQEVVKHKQVEEALQQRTLDLGERVKELTCLYGVSQLFEEPWKVQETVFKEFLALIPPAWQYPEITYARIIFEEETYTTDNFQETSWRQSADIMVSKKAVGTLEVYYREEMPEIFEGPFLKEERDLIDALTRQLAEFIVRKQADNALRESDERLKSFMEAAPDTIQLFDSNLNYIAINKAAEEEIGLPREEIIGKNYVEIFPHLKGTKRYEAYKEVIGTGKPFFLDGLKVVPRFGDKNFSVKAFKVGDGLGMIISDVTERKQAEETLRAINEELQDFASIVVHDLKAPLRNITNLVKWLARDSVDKLSEEGKDNLNLLVKQTTHMDSLIDGIHQYSKIDRVHKNIEELNLNELLSEVIEIISPPDNIEIAIQTELPVLAVDRTHMFQIFSNLLDNAVKFMDKPQGHIIIDHEEKETFWQFSVADNGPGIEENHFERIFQIFQTLSTTEEAKGTGIGLAIVKKVIEMNGGKIWLESTVGEGSTFYFTLSKPSKSV